MAGTASTAGRGRPAEPPQLKWLKSVDGDKGLDSGGRVIPEPVPFPRAAPEKPDTLNEDGVWLWDKVVEQMHSIGLLKPLDGPSLEVMCQTWARWRMAVRQRMLANADDPVNSHGGLLRENSQGWVAAPWVGIEERAAKDLRGWFAEYGITPAAEKNLRSEAAEAGGDGGNVFSGG